MVRGLYIAGTGMMLQRRQMEITTNNIANVETSGYKKDFLVSHSFDAVLIRRINDTSGVLGASRFVGPLNLGTQVDQEYIDFSSGSFDVTERTTDLALAGDVFFVVRTPDGERYTRNGAFYIDNLGYLVDGSGNFLLGQNGPIYVGGQNFSVNEQGLVWVNGQPADIIRVVSFANNETLRKQGNNLFYSTTPPMNDINPYIMRQGVLETSNIDVGREMVDMITLYRTYETNQRMLSLIDESVGRAVNEIGRLR